MLGWREHRDRLIGLFVYCIGADGSESTFVGNRLRRWDGGDGTD